MLIKRSNIIDVRDNGGRGIMRILDPQGRILWEKRQPTPPHPTPQFDDHDPLTIVKTDEGEQMIILTLNNKDKHIMYRTDVYGEWQDVVYGVGIFSVTLGKDEYVQFASDDTLSLGDVRGNTQFGLSDGTYEVYGNVQSLYNNSDTIPDYGCRRLFSGCKITKAPALPATNVGNYGYESMFQNTLITKAPEIYATTVGYYCCENMFNNCKELIYSPSVLPATTLGTFCYKSMFSNCKNLETAPELPARTIPTSGYNYMLSESTKLTEIKCYAINLGTGKSDGWLPYDLAGVFYKNPAYAVPSSRNSSTIPSNMTVVDWIK